MTREGIGRILALTVLVSMAIFARRQAGTAPQADTRHAHGEMTITNVRLEPAMSCVYASPHGCHMPQVLWVENHCPGDLRLGSLVLPNVRVTPREEAYWLLLRKDTAGKVLSACFDPYDRVRRCEHRQWYELEGRPLEPITAQGRVGGQPFSVAVASGSLRLSPWPKCLKGEAIGLNAKGALYFAHMCREDVVVHGFRIPRYRWDDKDPGGYYLVELFRLPSGDVDARWVDGPGPPLERYLPARSEILKVAAEAAGKKFSLSYEIHPPGHGAQGAGGS
jgi:hypothetical protein